MSSTTYIPENAAALFATHLRFRWEYELHDVFVTHRSTGRYTFSDTFSQRLEDLSTWTLDEQISGLAPDFLASYRCRTSGKIIMCLPPLSLASFLSIMAMATILAGYLTRTKYTHNGFLEREW